MKRITIPQIIRKMMKEFKGDIRDTDHALRVWTNANCVGELEGLDPETQFILEATAITHDIACPICREKYGDTEADHQEKEGEVEVRRFFADSGLTQKEIDRIAFIVRHHHSYEYIDGPDFQILVEADFIANAAEKRYSKERIREFLNNTMKTESGKQFLGAPNFLGAVAKLSVR